MKSALNSLPLGCLLNGRPYAMKPMFDLGIQKLERNGMEPRPGRSFALTNALYLVLILLAVAGPFVSQGADLNWVAGPGFQSASLNVGAGSKTGFMLLPPGMTGIHFSNQLAEDRHLINQIYLNGSGVAAGDVDGDGWCDLYFCNLDGPNRLFRNMGNWKFAEVPDAGGAALPSIASTGVALVDLDGDGDLDLIVNSVGQGTRIFFNNGKGRYTESPQTLNPTFGGMSLALGDIDGDGDLDLYVANYRTYTLRDQPNTRFSHKIVNGQSQITAINGRSITEPDLADRFIFNFTRTANGGVNMRTVENGEPDVLFRNDGKGRFVPISFTDGNFLDEDGRPLTKPPFDWGLSVMFRDLNGDGAPDVYVCNDFASVDRIWVNNGTGKFQAIPRLAIRQICLSSMGVDFADINRDGLDDIFVVDMLSRLHTRRLTQRTDASMEPMTEDRMDNRPQYPRNMLFLNQGDGRYAEIAQLSGLEASEWSWTPIFLDVDLDGWEDILVSTGFERDGMNMDAVMQLETIKKQQKLAPVEQLRLRKLFPRLPTGTLAFRNLGDLKFAEITDAWGFNGRGVAQGMGLADLDNDGDLDVVVNCLNGPALVYRNEATAPRLAVRLKGKAPNTHGIGAKIKVIGGPVAQSQEIICGGRYLSSDDAMRVFAAGSLTNKLAIEVIWRSGRRSVLTDVMANRIYEIEESSATNSASRITPDASHLTPFFKDVSELLNHIHHDEPFDDFSRQPLLPHRLSQLGPGVSWFDLDADGWDDLIIGSGNGGKMAVFRNDRKGGFQPLNKSQMTETQARDQTGVLGWHPGPGRTLLLAGSANYEDGQTTGSVVRQFDVMAPNVDDSLPAHSSSPGPLAMADIDGDGNLDLFVGGRVLPGRYPEPASSLMFRGVDGKFVLDAENTRRFANIGLVSGAVFSDLDGDGDPDLILACEWGPIRVFRNDGGMFAEITTPLGLDKYVGFWNGVTTGDFDGDGRLDIAASNWGRNTQYERFRTQPLKLYYGDLNGDGSVDIVEAYHDPQLMKWVPRVPLWIAERAMPFLRERWHTHEAYSLADLGQIYGDRLQGARELSATWLESTVFLNRSNRFEPRALPLEAQMSPAFGVCAADLDGDGREDLFLSQNFFGLPGDVSRSDAGRGLWLRGDGRGGFSVVSARESGMDIHGEQRAAALCDYDGDGRIDLVATQNSAQTRLFKNSNARPGLRVRLRGPPGNPEGVGATLRLLHNDQASPAREIHAGSGYWSQDSATQVMTMTSGQANRLWVRWPGGKTTTGNIPTEAKGIEVGLDGKVTVVQ